MIRLSIIIPAYNAAQYVERCLLSINNEAIRSGISQSEYEIIIVDDCSSDNTIERTLEYFNHLNLSNGKVICHHTNRKQGAARNTGLRVANGDYVWFVDIDDSIGDGILKYLHSSELSSMRHRKTNPITSSLNLIGKSQLGLCQELTIWNLKQ